MSARASTSNSIEKEIALGKQMAQEVERQAKIVDDPIIAEYVNRVGRTWCAIPTPRFLSRSR
jgi:predicted Zn-dependent protease